jgi:TonB family protein
MLTSWPSPKQAFKFPRTVGFPIAKSFWSTSKRLEWKLRLSCLTSIASAAIIFSATAVADRIDPFVLQGHELRAFGHASAHMAEFSPVSTSPLALPKCASVRPPEALLTPDPLFPQQDENVLVGVSFIIGSDGHVHSAFVTYSGGDDGDQAVLRAVRAWRYRPALCNGVPTDSEARVRFTVHE